jgi:hypothetical protein
MTKKSMMVRWTHDIIRMRGRGLEGYLAFPLLWYSKIYAGHGMNTRGACVRQARSKHTSAACSADLIVEIRA